MWRRLQAGLQTLHTMLNTEMCTCNPGTRKANTGGSLGLIDKSAKLKWWELQLEGEIERREWWRKIPEVEVLPPHAHILMWKHTWTNVYTHTNSPEENNQNKQWFICRNSTMDPIFKERKTCDHLHNPISSAKQLPSIAYTQGHWLVTDLSHDSGKQMCNFSFLQNHRGKSLTFPPRTFQVSGRLAGKLIHRCLQCMPGKGSYGHPTGEGSPSEEGKAPAWLCWACKVSLKSFRRADPIFVLQSLCFLCLPCGQLMCSSRLVAAMTGNLTLQFNDPEIYCSWMTDISSLLGDSTGMSSPRFLYPFPA